MKLGIANQAENDSNRRQLDIVAGQILGLTQQEAEVTSQELAGLWCAEASVQ